MQKKLGFDKMGSYICISEQELVSQKHTIRNIKLPFTIVNHTHTLPN